MPSIEEKEKIRREMLEKLSNQSREDRSRKNKLIKEKLFSLAEFKKSKSLLCYISLPAEAGTRGIIKEALKLGKLVFAPVVNGDNLEISEIRDLDKNLGRGPLDVLQPKTANCRSRRSEYDALTENLDLAIIPGLAYDKRGNRLGRGKGYFDRFLKNLPEAVKKIGLAYDFQILKSVPILPHDIPVDLVISN